MKVTFLAPVPPDVSAFGIRSLSSYLKQYGKDVSLVFLPGGVEKFRHKVGYKYQYEKSIIEQVVELCRGADLVGISFMSNYLDRAMQLSHAIKESLDVPLILGGAHPTVMPEACLEFANMVCIGEGEEAILELVIRMENDRDCGDVRNLYLKNGNRIVKNQLRPLIQDLDRLPHYDFGIEGHFIYDNIKKCITPMTRERLRRSFPLEPHLEGSFNDSYNRTLSYKTMTTRGCPHHCTFCMERTLSSLYAEQRYLRIRSISHIMDELIWVRRNLPFVESIFFFDDTFLVRSTSEIEKFSRVYKENVGIPFHIQASPGTVADKKIEALVDAGLVFVEMGIQSTSDRGKELYKRKTTTKTILRAADLFHKYTDKISPPCYHVILDNPWETTSDVIETLSTVLKLPSPFWLKRASLVLYPGTELYYKAKAEGIIRTSEDEWREIYSKHLHDPAGSYCNFLMYLAGFSNFPRWIIRILSKKILIKLFDRQCLNNIYSMLKTLGDYLIILSKGFGALIRGDFRRIQNYFVRIK